MIFTIKSFDGLNGSLSDEEVTIGILNIYSSIVKDKYGISVGTRYLDVIKIRSEGLEFGAGHFTNYLGKNKIWYTLSHVEIIESHGTYKYPVGVESITKDDAERENPTVRLLSWPDPSWD